MPIYFSGIIHGPIKQILDFDPMMLQNGGSELGRRHVDLAVLPQMMRGKKYGARYGQ